MTTVVTLIGLNGIQKKNKKGGHGTGMGAVRKIGGK